MTTKPSSIYNSLQFFLLVSLLSVVPCNQVKAQLTPDNTLGSENSRVRNQTTGKRIEGGAIRGKNLFHSFKEFNVNNNTTVNFGNPSGIENIFTRVTGVNPSQINGVLGVLGNANLFLLNPNGISFGANASLSLNGSFFATTADGFLFDNGFAFSASNPTAPPLLTINIPIGLNFRATPGEIRLNQSSLEIPQGETLTLSGGNVRFVDAIIQARGGEIKIEATQNVVIDKSLISTIIGQNLVSNAGKIDITGQSVTVINGTSISSINVGKGNGGIINLNAFETLLIDGSILYTNVGYYEPASNLVIPSEGNSGDINLTAKSLTINKKSGLITSLYGKGNGGNININVKDTVTFDGDETVARTSVLEKSEGNSGNINIKSKSINVINNANLHTNNLGNGNGGNINFEANEKVVFDRNEVQSSSVGSKLGSYSEIPGKAGDINITAGSVLINQTTLDSRKSGNGNGGNITIIATDEVTFNDSSAIASAGDYDVFSQTSNTLGNSGNITIKASSINLKSNQSSLFGGGSLSATVQGNGNGGEVNISATDAVTFDGFLAGIYSGVTFNGVEGNGGDINISAKSVTLDGGANFNTAVSGKGKAGNININADIFSLNPKGGSPFNAFNAVLATGAEGKGGDINITAKEFSITNSFFGNSTSGKGDAGNININADNVNINGGLARVTTEVFPEAQGNGGNININAKSISLTLGARLLSSTQGTGNAGNIIIKADNLNIDGVTIFAGEPQKDQPSGAFSNVRANASGKGGNIEISANFLTLSEGATIRSTSNGDGNPGNIIVDVKDEINFNQATASSALLEQGIGIGGNITLNTQNLNLTNNSQIISSTAAQGIAGNITLTVENTISLRDRSSINVDSTNTGGGGNIQLTTQNLNLNNSSISAETTSSTGGNLTLKVENLSQLRQGSQISTTAGTSQGPGDGGNISLDSLFLVATPQENSDIKANSYQGLGGKIEIASQGIFGTEIRDRQTQESDITAISQLNPALNGEVIFTPPEIDPTRGLIALPEEVIDPNDLIAQNACQRGKQSEFIVIGKGGLALTPEQTATGENIRVSWAKPALNEVSTSAFPAPETSNFTILQRVIPAQGWIVNPQGKIELVAYNPNGDDLTGKNLRSYQPLTDSCQTNSK